VLHIRLSNVSPTEQTKAEERENHTGAGEIALFSYLGTSSSNECLSVYLYCSDAKPTIFFWNIGTLNSSNAIARIRISLELCPPLGNTRVAVVV